MADCPPHQGPVDPGSQGEAALATPIDLTSNVNGKVRKGSWTRLTSWTRNIAIRVFSRRQRRTRRRQRAEARSKEVLSSEKSKEVPVDDRVKEIPAEVASKEDPAEVASKEEPAEVASKEEPAEVASKEEPAEVASKEEPAEIAAKEEPAEVTTKEEPAEVSSKEEPAEVTTKEESAEVASKEEPAEVASKEEPADVASKEEPAEVASKEEPAEVACKEEPAELAPKEEPAEVTFKEEPAEVASKEEPAEVTTKEESSEVACKGEPAEVACKEEPAEVASKEGPTDVGSKEEPAEVACKAEPSEVACKEKPAEVTSKEEPVEVACKEEQAEVTTKEEPVEVASKEEPAEVASKEELAEVTTKEEPAEVITKEEPAEVITKEEQSEFAPKKEPAEVAPKEEPAEVACKEKPAEVTTKEEPADVASKEEPAEVASKEEPAVVASKEEPADVASKEEPAEDASKEEPAEVACKEEPAEVAPKEDPAEVTFKEEPAEVASKDQPAEVACKEEPAEVACKEKPAEVAPKENPAEVACKEEPALVNTKEEPAEVAYKEEPAEVTTKEEPAEVITKKEPAEVASKKEPAEVASEEEPAEVASKEISSEDRYKEKEKITANKIREFADLSEDMSVEKADLSAEVMSVEKVELPGDRSSKEEHSSEHSSTEEKVVIANRGFSKYGPNKETAGPVVPTTGDDTTKPTCPGDVVHKIIPKLPVEKDKACTDNVQSISDIIELLDSDTSTCKGEFVQSIENYIQMSNDDYPSTEEELLSSDEDLPSLSDTGLKTNRCVTFSAQSQVKDIRYSSSDETTNEVRIYEVPLVEEKLSSCVKKGKDSSSLYDSNLKIIRRALFCHDNIVIDTEYHTSSSESESDNDEDMTETPSRTRRRQALNDFSLSCNENVGSRAEHMQACNDASAEEDLDLYLWGGELVYLSSEAETAYRTGRKHADISRNESDGDDETSTSDDIPLYSWSSQRKQFCSEPDTSSRIERRRTFMNLGEPHKEDNLSRDDELLEIDPTTSDDIPLYSWSSQRTQFCSEPDTSCRTERRRTFRDVGVPSNAETETSFHTRRRQTFKDVGVPSNEDEPSRNNELLETDPTTSDDIPLYSWSNQRTQFCSEPDTSCRTERRRTFRDVGVPSTADTETSYRTRRRRTFKNVGVPYNEDEPSTNDELLAIDPTTSDDIPLYSWSSQRTQFCSQPETFSRIERRRTFMNACVSGKKNERHRAADIQPKASYHTERRPSFIVLQPARNSSNRQSNPSLCQSDPTQNQSSLANRRSNNSIPDAPKLYPYEPIDEASSLNYWQDNSLHEESCPKWQNPLLNRASPLKDWSNTIMHEGSSLLQTQAEISKREVSPNVDASSSKHKEETCKHIENQLKRKGSPTDIFFESEVWSDLVDDRDIRDEPMQSTDLACEGLRQPSPGKGNYTPDELAGEADLQPRPPDPGKDTDTPEELMHETDVQLKPSSPGGDRDNHRELASEADHVRLSESGSDKSVKLVRAANPEDRSPYPGNESDTPDRLAYEAALQLPVPDSSGARDIPDELVCVEEIDPSFIQETRDISEELACQANLHLRSSSQRGARETTNEIFCEDEQLPIPSYLEEARAEQYELVCEEDLQSRSSSQGRSKDTSNKIVCVAEIHPIPSHPEEAWDLSNEQTFEAVSQSPDPEDTKNNSDEANLQMRLSSPEGSRDIPNKIVCVAEIHPVPAYLEEPWDLSDEPPVEACPQPPDLEEAKDNSAIADVPQIELGSIEAKDILQLILQLGPSDPWETRDICDEEDIQTIPRDPKPGPDLSTPEAEALPPGYVRCVEAGSPPAPDGNGPERASFWRRFARGARNLATRLIPRRKRKRNEPRMFPVQEPENNALETALSCFAEGRHLSYPLDPEIVYSETLARRRIHVIKETGGGWLSGPQGFEIHVDLRSPYSSSIADSELEPRKSLRKRVREALRQLACCHANPEP